MKAIMVMFDTLNRRMLQPYGCDWTHTPNFKRLSEKTVTFDNCFIGSMPCMPARRELHTGRYNFLHRSWGPVEPFDDSMPEILWEHGVYTHLVSDHYHYIEDGGGTYHNRYRSYDIVRGQEGDPLKGVVKDPVIPEAVRSKYPSERWRDDWVNRQYIREEEQFPQAQTFAKGLEFIHKNHTEENWFLQIETFDPHEPFYAPQTYKDLYPHEYTGKHFDWPPYGQVKETQEEIQHMRYEYAALLSMCDAHLGKVLDAMDTYDLWKDTMLIVCTDHGFLLAEHDQWAKSAQPFYNEVAHTPLFIWDPRSCKKGERRSSLAQLIDMAPTLLDYFNVEIPKDMRGKPLEAVVAADEPVRQAALFGIFGGHVNCTDGRYVYMRAPVTADNSPLFQYTLMPTHMRGFFREDELNNIELAEPFSFTKGFRVMQIRSGLDRGAHRFGTLLFNVERDPGQMNPLQDPQVEQEMARHMIRLMRENDAPAEQFVRLGLEGNC